MARRAPGETYVPLFPARPTRGAGCPTDLTPVEAHGGIFLKRDDRFTVAGVHGGKARTCAWLADGAQGLVTAGSRHSPQVNIVAHIARSLGIPCRAHVPAGDPGPEVVAAADVGAEIVAHRPGYNSVIVSRARMDSASRGWREIPFGMECWEAVEATAAQTENIPPRAKRVVVPVGSGMSLAGVLWGLRDRGRTLPVVGVRVGASPDDRLETYAPPGWEAMAKIETSPYDYGEEPPPKQQWFDGVRLDPVYEAKCVAYLRDGDVFWLVGVRDTLPAGVQ